MRMNSQRSSRKDVFGFSRIMAGPETRAASSRRKALQHQARR
jgi:hypothetical protein